MSLFRRVFSGLTPGILGIFISTLVHAGTAGGLYLWSTARKALIVAELDLSMAPLLPRASNKGGGRGRLAEEWFTHPKNKKTPIPAPPLPVQDDKKEKRAPAVEEEESLPCQGPCAEGNASGGGGTGEGYGLYVPASETSRPPRWIDNFITSADYPLLARQNGRDGRVVLSVLIDDTGRVRDVRLLQGTYEALNEVALRKVRGAKFTPAYDVQGRAVSCKVTLPIRFELR